MKDGTLLKDLVYGPPIFEPVPSKDKAGNIHKVRCGICEFCGCHWQKCATLKDQVIPEGYETE